MRTYSAHQDAVDVLALLVLLCAVFGASAAATCGNGIQEEGEQCEDGNLFDSDGCSARCYCENDPCQFTVGGDVHLASIAAGLAPGATVSLAATTYAGDGACGWVVASVLGTNARAITLRGAVQGKTKIDCGHSGPIIDGIVRGTHLRLEHIDFTNAQRSGSGGALVRAEEDSHIVLDGCRVTNCGTDGEGGAVLVSNSSLLVTHSHFEENNAQVFGGGMAIVDGATAVLTDSTFIRCIAGSGGAVYVARASSITMERMLFFFNSAVTGQCLPACLSVRARGQRLSISVRISAGVSGRGASICPSRSPPPASRFLEN